MNGSIKNILIPGIENNPKTTLVDDIDECDYIILDFRHLIINYKIIYPHKTIIVDYRDLSYEVSKCECLLYFKRSVVNKQHMKFCNFNRKIHPISYCLRKETMSFVNIFENKRKFDISCMINPNNQMFNNRKNLAFKIKNSINNNNVFVGEKGNSGQIGRTSIQNEYFKHMLDSKIVVTCNPDQWEGDYRLFEALACGCLVFVDNMLTPFKNKFTDGINICYYDNNDLNKLIERINYYLEHDDERLQIAKNGYEFTRKYHKPSNRIDEILEEINKL